MYTGKTHICLLTTLTIALLVILSGCKKGEKLSDQEDTHPGVFALEIIPISPTRVTLKGSLTSKGKIKVQDYGFVYDVRGYFDGPTMKTVSLGSEAKTGEFTTIIEGLNPGMYVDDRDELYIKAYYTNESGTVYSERIRVDMPKLSSQRVYPLEGKIGDKITISGDFFISGTKQLKVLFEQLEARIVSATDKEIVVEVPAGIPLRHKEWVTVDVNIDGQIIRADNDFVILASFRDFSPKSGPIGTLLHFTGENLPAGFSTVSNIAVKIGEEAAHTGAAEEFVTNVPSVKAVKNKVSFKVNGVEVILPGEFTVTPPIISSVSPTVAYAGDQLTIKGSNFPLIEVFDFAKVNVGTLSTSAGIYEGDILASIPYMPAGTYPLSLTSGPFTILAPQQLTIKPFEMFSFSPAAQYTGSTIIIKGNTFSHSPSFAVFFGDKRVEGRTISDSELSVEVPMGVNGDQFKMTVQMNSGERYPVPGTFVVKGPVIQSISPLSGGPGTQVTVKGANFRSAGTNGYINLGPGYVDIDEVIENTIKFTIPHSAAPSTTKVTVTIFEQRVTSESSFTVTK